MKLTMKNIGVIRDAEIELDGITVLAGLNGSGKSTASKALYSIIEPYANLSEKIADSRKFSIQGVIITFFNQASMELSNREAPRFPLQQVEKLSFEIGNHRRPIPTQYEDWLHLFPQYLKNNDIIKTEFFPKFLEKLRNAVTRETAEYVQFLLDETIEIVFDGQINTIGSPLPAEITLTVGQGIQIARMKIAENRIVECSENEISKSPPIYLDTHHILDWATLRSFYGEKLSELLGEPLSKPTFEEYKSRKRVQDTIASVIHGKLTTSTFGEFMFKDDKRKEPISLRNVASGNKTFAVLQRLIENGALRENTVLIIDEPESNQHPEWQLKLAEVLVLIQRELGVRIFLTTHSTYFLRAIEVYSKQYGLSGHCHYYQTQPVDDAEGLFCIRNVDGNTKLIYRDFYLPFEEL